MTYEDSPPQLRTRGQGTAHCYRNAKDKTPRRHETASASEDRRHTVTLIDLGGSQTKFPSKGHELATHNHPGN